MPKLRKLFFSEAIRPTVKIDKVVAKVLRQNDFAILRTLLAIEPVVCLKRL